MKNSVLLFTFILLLSFSAQSQDFDYSFKESYEVKAPANLTVSSDNSHIDVIAHKGNNIEVFYTVKKGNNVLKLNREEVEREIKEQWKLDIENTSRGLKIAVINTIKEGYVNSEDAFIIDFKVYVPELTSSQLHSSDGDILLQGLALDQKCITSDGDIKLIDLTGRIYAETSDGDILLENVTGIVDSHTWDGSVINLTYKKL